MPSIVKSAAAIICGSQHAKQDIMKAYGLPCSKVRVIHYGVDHERFQPGAILDADWASSLGIREGYLLHVGVFSHRKNIPFLLRAIAHLRDKNIGKPIQLVLVGLETPALKGAAEVHQTIKELHLEDSIVLAGRVPDKHIPGLYAQAKALIMPSLYEGFGFPIVESMAAGTPVIASNSSSLPEVAGDAAVLASPTDVQAFASSIEEVISNPRLAAELRLKGLARAKHFNWQRTAAETVDVYRSVAK